MNLYCSCFLMSEINFTSFKKGKTMSQLNEILSRLSGVRNAPSDNYQANCPCPHHSKTNNGKLYLKDMGDKVVMDCKSGCTAMEVLYEIEMTLSDLYPPTSPVDRETWRNKQAVVNAAKEKDDQAIRLFTEICIIKQAIEARIFNNDKHPENKSECWDREKEAIRMLPIHFKEYYSGK